LRPMSMAETVKQQRCGPADEALGEVPRPGVAGEADGAAALDARVALRLGRWSALLHHVTDGVRSRRQVHSASGDCARNGELRYTIKRPQALDLPPSSCAPHQQPLRTCDPRPRLRERRRRSRWRAPQSPPPAHSPMMLDGSRQGFEHGIARLTHMSQPAL